MRTDDGSYLLLKYVRRKARTGEACAIALLVLSNTTAEMVATKAAPPLPPPPSEKANENVTKQLVAVAGALRATAIIASFLTLYLFSVICTFFL